MIIKQLKDGADPDCKYVDGSPLIIEACKRNMRSVIEHLCTETNFNINASDSKGQTALFSALKASTINRHADDWQMYDYLISHGADPTKKDKKQRSLVHYWQPAYNIPLAQIIQTVPVDVQDINLHTALHLALIEETEQKQS